MAKSVECVTAVHSHVIYQFLLNLFALFVHKYKIPTSKLKCVVFLQADVEILKKTKGIFLNS